MPELVGRFLLTALPTSRSPLRKAQHLMSFVIQAREVQAWFEQQREEGVDQYARLQVALEKASNWMIVFLGAVLVVGGTAMEVIRSGIECNC